MLDELRKEALEEYYCVQQRIADFDNRIISVKSWGTTATGALIGLSFSQDQPLMLIAGAMFAIVFWFIEAQWKSFQLIALDHARHIERLVSSDEDSLKAYRGPTIGAAYDTAFQAKHKFSRFKEAARQAYVWLPYLPLAIFSLALYLAYKLGVLEVGEHIVS